MSTMMFDDLEFQQDNAIESTEPTEVTVDGLMMPEANGLPLETMQKLEGIEMGMEAIATIDRIMQIARKSSPQDAGLIKMTNIAIEEIKGTVGIFSDGTIVAMECVNENGISLEGLGDIIASIWEAIVRTFNSIWNAVRGLFRSSKSDIDKAAAHKAAIDMKGLAVKAKAKGAEIPHVLTGELELITKPFAFMGDNLNVPSLIVEVQKLIRTIRSCEHLVNTLELANVNMEVAVNKFNSSGIDAKSEGFADQAIQSYYNAIEDNFLKDEDLSDYKEVLSEKLSIDYNTVDRKSIRTLDGLTRGSKIFAFHVNGDDSYGVEYHFLSLHEYLKHTESVAEKFSFEGDAETSHAYAEQLAAAFDEISSLLGTYEQKFNRMNAMQKRILKTMGDFIYRKESTGNSDGLPERIRSYQEVARALIKATLSLNGFIVFAERAAYDHSRMVKYLIAKWNTAVQSVD